jgi:carbonic anhydrase
LQQVNETRDGQFPFAAVLSCIDSRTSAELIFDQGLGDIFSIRIAGNIISDEVLGSMEFACKIAGSKLIVVLGHTKCGAIKGACDNLQMGNLSTLLNKIQPAVYFGKQKFRKRRIRRKSRSHSGQTQRRKHHQNERRSARDGRTRRDRLDRRHL